MIELKSTIERCLKRCKPPVQLYVENDDGSFNKIHDGVVADIESATEELEYEISNYLRTKEAEINNKLTQAKCDAYELALTRTRPIETIREGKHESRRCKKNRQGRMWRYEEGIYKRISRRLPRCV